MCSFSRSCTCACPKTQTVSKLPKQDSHLSEVSIKARSDRSLLGTVLCRSHPTNFPSCAPLEGRGTADCTPGSRRSSPCRSRPSCRSSARCGYSTCHELAQSRPVRCARATDAAAAANEEAEEVEVEEVRQVGKEEVEEGMTISIRGGCRGDRRRRDRHCRRRRRHGRWRRRSGRPRQ